MSVSNYISDKLCNFKDSLTWQLTYTSVGNWLFYPFWWLMRRERGTEFPFYFPTEANFAWNNLTNFANHLDNFVNYHETERNIDGTVNKTFTERIKYVLSHFHIYSNDTMSNLYFETKIPRRDIQRAEEYYNYSFLAFLAYNTLSGSFLVALNNHFFRLKRTSIPVVFLASLTTTALFAVNYKLSYAVMDANLNRYVRRLGHKSLVHRYGSSYPRNVDYCAY